MFPMLAPSFAAPAARHRPVSRGGVAAGLGRADSLRGQGWGQCVWRWLLVLLMCWMPLQMSWATVARYCVDEAVAAPAQGAHLGHHVHQHALAPLASTLIGQGVQPADMLDTQHTADSSADPAAHGAHDSHLAQGASGQEAQGTQGSHSALDSDCRHCQQAALSLAFTSTQSRTPSVRPTVVFLAPSARFSNWDAQRIDRPQWLAGFAGMVWG